jgi:uncharacterized protein (TIGR01777 family)
VVRLVRRPASAPDEVRWDPAAGEIDEAALGHVDAAVNLAGAGVGDHRWTASYKRELMASRVDATSTIARALARMQPTPRVLVSASAVGWYGDTGREPVDETGAPGRTYLAEICRRWEQAAAPAADAGIRVVHPRSALIMAARGGAFGRLRLALLTGLGGPLGSGRQYWSWITIDDEVRALQFLLGHESLSGPVNLSAPVPVTNAEVTRACARALHRPALVPVPAVALRTVLGEFATEMLIDQRVEPARLKESGFRFEHPDIDTAARAVFGSAWD